MNNPLSWRVGDDQLVEEWSIVLQSRRAYPRALARMLPQLTGGAARTMVDYSRSLDSAWKSIPAN